MPELHPAIISNNLGLAFFNRGMFQEAEQAYRRAIDLVPTGAYAEAFNNLGIVLQQTNRLVEASTCYRRAMQISPVFSRAASNMACVCEEIGRYDDAIKFYRHALRLEPGVGAIWHNLAGTLRETRRYIDAKAAYEKCLELDPKNAQAHCSYVYTVDQDPSATVEERRAIKQKWNDLHSLRGARPAPINPDPERRLRIGYVGGDFRLHSVAFAFADVLFGHDRKKFEVFCYSSTVREDDATDKFQCSVDHWRRIVGKSDHEVAKYVRDDQIDILVDMSGYTAANRLTMFTLHPAPVQLHAWGYLNAPGIPSIPVTVMDDVLDPDGEHPHLPCVFHYRAPLGPDVNQLPALTTSHVTLGYLGRWSKVTAEVAALWREVMAEIPNSRLVIKDKTFVSSERREKAIELLGIPAERLETLVTTGHFDHLADHHRIDIGLDPWPTNGGVSTLEALWMGIPIVTMPGDRPSSRVGASVMTTLGLSEFVANGAASYIGAVRNALHDRKRLNGIRLGMRERMQSTVLGNAALYVAHLERLYRDLWRKACRATS